METLRPYAIDPALRDGPPRAARLPFATTALLCLASVILGLIVLGGGRVGLEAGKMAQLNRTGRTVSARIVSVRTLPPAGVGQKPVREITYQYSWPFGVGETRTGVGQTPQGTFHVGDTLTVLCGEWHGQRMTAAGGRIPASKIGFLGTCAAVLVGMGAGLLLRLFRWRARRLDLLRRGIATVGTVLHRHAQSHDTPRYFLRFGYQAGETAYERDEQVTVNAWKRAEVGQPVTVLYLPEHPEAGSLYGV